MRRLVGLAGAAFLTTALFTAPAAAAAPAPAPFAAQQEAGALPPMGWNSWNKFGCNINEELIRETADAIVASGLRDAGYQYVNIDDCWAEQNRNAEGKFEPNHERFPSGIKALADYVHAKGLKLGIYTSAGTQTCAKTMPGALDHEDVDAQTFADWGVDYSTGAGGRQLSTEPSGAVTCTGQNEPALCGASGETAAFTANDAYARV